MADIVRNDASVMACPEFMLERTKVDLTDIPVIKYPMKDLARLDTFAPATSYVLSRTRGVRTVYELLNDTTGSGLKTSKGDYIGYLKAKDTRGKNPCARFRKVSTSTVDPSTYFAMAIVLYEVNNKLDRVIDMTKEISDFLSNDKESKIESDLEFLTTAYRDYQFNTQNEQFLTSHHVQILSIRRAADANVHFYRKQLKAILADTSFIRTSKNIDAKRAKLQNALQYYQMSLYTFAFSSTLDVMFGSNSDPEYLQGVYDDIERRSFQYRDDYAKSRHHLDEFSGTSLEIGTLHNIGEAGKAIGSAIGSIPVLGKLPIGSMIKEAGTGVRKAADKMHVSVLDDMNRLCLPMTDVFTEQLLLIEKMSRIERVYVCDEDIYLKVA